MHPIALLHYMGLPLRTAPLVLIVLFSLMLTLAVHAGIFGVPLFLMIGSWFLKYGFALLDNVIEGRRDVPVISAEIVNPFQQRPLWLFFLLILFYFLTALLQPWIGSFAVTGLRIFLLALVPSMVASMSITGRFVEALNPITVFGTIARIPVAYGALLVTIGGLWFVAIELLQAVGDSAAGHLQLESLLPQQIFFLVGTHGVIAGLFGLMLFMYLWLAMFACIGGTIFERRRELAIDPAGSPERAAARIDAEVERQRDKTMERIFAELRGGALGNAGATVRKIIEQSSQPIEECRWLYVRATLLADQRLANYLAQLSIPRLLSARATGEALKMTRDRLSVAPDFRPETGGQLLQLVQLARDAGDRAMARNLLANFSKCYPNDPMESAAAKLQADLAR
jgi:hypothetical protein